MSRKIILIKQELLLLVYELNRSGLLAENEKIRPILAQLEKLLLQAGLRRDAVQPDIEAERKKRDEIEAGKSYCSRRFGGATCDDKSAQIYARFDKNDWRIQPAEFY